MSSAGSVISSHSNQGQNGNQGKEGNAWHEFDILAAVVSRYQNAAPKKPQSPEHRISCHRCGNIRKRRILCTRSTCPHTFCGRCAEKMKEEHGLDVFFGGCPVCKELCCCNNKSVFCHRKNHCYRKCPATKTNGKQPNMTIKDDSDSEPYHEELASIPKPENAGQYGIFDLLAAVADMDKSQALGKQAKLSGGVASSSSSSAAAPRKKAKLGKDGVPNSKDLYPTNMLLCEPSYSQYFSSAVPESVGNMQLLNSKVGDSGVDGYTFNNNTMGIIRGGMGGVTDAIALMGQQKISAAAAVKNKFHVGMDKFGAMSSTDPLLTSLSAPINTAVSSSSAGGSSLPASQSAATSAALSAYNRLPSIDSNPFSGALPQRETPTFDQALLDSVRNLQPDPFNMPLSRPLPSVPKSLAPQAATSAAALASTALASAGVEAPKPPATTAAEPQPSVSAAALEPMNLLALVSSFTSSLDKSKHVLPADHLLLNGGANPTAGDAAAQNK